MAESKNQPRPGKGIEFFASPNLRMGLLMEDHPAAKISYTENKGKDVNSILAQRFANRDFMVCTIEIEGREPAIGWIDVDKKAAESPENYVKLQTSVLGRALKRAGYPDNMGELRAVLTWRQRNAQITEAEIKDAFEAAATVEDTEPPTAAGPPPPAEDPPAKAPAAQVKPGENRSLNRVADAPVGEALAEPKPVADAQPLGPNVGSSVQELVDEQNARRDAQRQSDDDDADAEEEDGALATLISMAAADPRISALFGEMDDGQIQTTTKWIESRPSDTQLRPTVLMAFMRQTLGKKTSPAQAKATGKMEGEESPPKPEVVEPPKPHETADLDDEAKARAFTEALRASIAQIAEHDPERHVRILDALADEDIYLDEPVLALDQISKANEITWGIAFDAKVE